VFRHRYNVYLSSVLLCSRLYSNSEIGLDAGDGEEARIREGQKNGKIERLKRDSVSKEGSLRENMAKTDMSASVRGILVFSAR